MCIYNNHKNIGNSKAICFPACCLLATLLGETQLVDQLHDGDEAETTTGYSDAKENLIRGTALQEDGNVVFRL